MGRKLDIREFLLYSGHKEVNAPHTQGVALMLSREEQKALIGWESHGFKIIKESFKTKKDKAMNFIQCSASTNDSSEDDEDQFYEAAVDCREVSRKGPNLPDGKPKRQSRGGQPWVLQDLLKEEKANMKDNWKVTKETVTLTCQEVLGRKHHHNERIYSKIQGSIQERKNKKTAINNSRTRLEKVKTHTECTEANSRMKSSIRTDKQKYVKDLAMTTENSTKEGNMRI
ncbi:unnamed protein product [Schistosoma margrebowiei]|uniref:Uncharacterized protein n=1 Tax=Schistosoma margrebowiei TaxID=48269 RepID=A0A183N6G8_9TREM|nr:unnamed protein product [Schistosoma margrebowiei]